MLRRIAVLLTTILLISSFTISFASDIVDVTYVPITCNNFEVDSLNGVGAYYNLYNRNYQCNEYVIRYYSEVYGLDIDTNVSGPSVDEDTGCWFEKTETPKAGDIIYSPYWKRNKSYSHWAVVKSYSDGVITVIEQNWRWNGQAAFERQVTYPSSQYDVYTLKGLETETEATVAATVPVTASSTAAPSYYISTWAQNDVQLAIDNKIVPVTCNYQSDITRKEFCELTINLLTELGVNMDLANNTTTFNDCDSEKVLLAAKLGLVQGGTDGCFYPDKTITREQAAVIIGRTLSYLVIADDAQTEITAYTDAEKISNWADEAITDLTSKGIVQGTDGGNFNPQQNITRESAITLQIRLLRYLGDLSTETIVSNMVIS